MTRVFLGNTFLATGVCLSGELLEGSFWQLLLSRQVKRLFLKRDIFFSLGSEGLLKKVASHTLKQPPVRAWMTGLILAIFGLWLATI